MSTNNTLLCVHRNPDQLSLLEEHGYELITATSGCEGLRLFMSKPVDAIVLEYHLGLLDGADIADEIKRVRPAVPIVMLADHLELPDGALKSVDAIVTKSDGAHFLLATVHFMLNVRPAQRRETKANSQAPRHFRGTDGLAAKPSRAGRAQPAEDEKSASLSPKEWRSIRNGTIQF
jgi:DNA-binding response OmpR family regulator